MRGNAICIFATYNLILCCILYIVRMHVYRISCAEYEVENQPELATWNIKFNLNISLATQLASISYMVCTKQYSHILFITHPWVVVSSCVCVWQMNALIKP